MLERSGEVLPPQWVAVSQACSPFSHHIPKAQPYSLTWRRPLWSQAFRGLRQGRSGNRGGGRESLDYRRKESSYQHWCVRWVTLKAGPISLWGLKSWVFMDYYLCYIQQPIIAKTKLTKLWPPRRLTESVNHLLEGETGRGPQGLPSVRFCCTWTSLGQAWTFVPRHAPYAAQGPRVLRPNPFQW